ncbi:MAG: phosphatase PAP2 family protein [Bacteroidota bacterium]
MSKERFITTQAIPYSTRAANRGSFRLPGSFGRRPIVGLTMFVLGSLVLGVLAYNVSTEGPLLRWDELVAEQFHAAAVRGSPAMVEFLDWGFFAGKPLIIIISAVLCLYFLYKRFWRELVSVAVGVGGAGTLWFILTHSFGRVRPPTQMGTIVTDPSFPSGHTATAVVCYGLLAYLLLPHIKSRGGKWAVVVGTALIIFYIGFSRLFLNAHYLTDVIGGFALGIAWAGLVFTMIETLFQGGKKQHVRTK